MLFFQLPQFAVISVPELASICASLELLTDRGAQASQVTSPALQDCTDRPMGKDPFLRMARELLHQPQHQELASRFPLFKQRQ